MIQRSPKRLIHDADGRISHAGSYRATVAASNRCRAHHVPVSTSVGALGLVVVKVLSVAAVEDFEVAVVVVVVVAVIVAVVLGRRQKVVGAR